MSQHALSYWILVHSPCHPRPNGWSSTHAVTGIIVSSMVLFLSVHLQHFISQIGNKFIFNFPASRGLSQQQEKWGKGFSLLARKYSTPRGPTHKFLGWGGGGIQQRFIFFTQKNHNFRICLPKKITTFLAHPPKSLSSFFATQKNPSVFFATQKNPGVFHRPQKIIFGQNFRPKNIIRTPPPPSLKYVSGAPGIQPLSLCNQVTYCTTAYLNRLPCILLGWIPMLLLFLKLLHRHLKEWGAWVSVSPGQIYENLWVSWFKIVLFRSLWV